MDYYLRDLSGCGNEKTRDFDGLFIKAQAKRLGASFSVDPLTAVIFGCSVVGLIQSRGKISAW